MPNSNWKHAKRPKHKPNDIVIKRGPPRRVGVIVQKDQAVELNRVPLTVTTANNKKLHFFEALEWGEAISSYSHPYIEGKVPILNAAFSLVDEVERMIDRCRRFKDNPNDQSSR